MKRKFEFYEPIKLLHDKVVANAPKRLYPQETDWTCSLACIRTMLSGFIENVPDEDFYVEKYKMEPGPYYSKDIKKIGILDEYDVVYGCDEKDKTFDKVLDYVEDGYFVMLESMYNYMHWYVLLGYYPLKNGDIEESRMLVYDPYYDKIKLLNVDEFIAMWIDGDFEHTKVKEDFIAVKAV